MSKGAQGVGKTNLITRLTKDEFVENHNLILEGQQTTLLHLNRTQYQLIFEDRLSTLPPHADPTSLASLPHEYYNNTNGILFVFAFDKEETFESTERELGHLEQMVLPNLKKWQVLEQLLRYFGSKLVIPHPGWKQKG